MAHVIHVTRSAGIALAMGLVVLLAFTGCASPPASSEPASRPERPDAPVREPDVEAPEASVPVPEPVLEVEVAPPQTPEPAPTMPPDDAPAGIPEPQPAPEPALEPVEPQAPESIPEPVEAPMPEFEPSPAPPARFNLAGRVVLTGRDADVAETVLYFEPDAPNAALQAGRFEIATRDKNFEPVVMAVTRGSVIRFPNQDPILHNVFSVSSGNAFDLGVYGPDAAPETRMDQPGAVNVYCNVHHEMHAHVLVLDTPWFAHAEADGGFALADLPPGPGTLHAWHRQAEAWSMRIEGEADGPIEARLNIVHPQLPAHTDKTGQSYFRKDRDPYR